MNTHEWLRTILTLAMLCLCIWFFFFQVPENIAQAEKQRKEYWENPQFKTDSLKVAVDYSKLPKPTYKNYVPPQIVIQYKPPVNDPHTSVTVNDSLIKIIDSLNNRITIISKAFLTLNPLSSKLIYGTFNQDTIRLDLLNPSGGVFTSVYPVNYAQFHYQYKDDHFEAEANRKKASKQSMHGVLFGYAGYGVTYKTALLGLDYSLHKGKLRLGANSFITIEQSPTFNLNGTLGYRLYGRE